MAAVSRIIVIASIALALSSAVGLYLIAQGTSTLEAKAAAHERAIETLKRDIAVLRAERAHLARPDRIEPLARRMGLAPPRPAQLRETDTSSPMQGTTARAGAR